MEESAKYWGLGTSVCFFTITYVSVCLCVLFDYYCPTGLSEMMEIFYSDCLYVAIQHLEYG